MIHFSYGVNDNVKLWSTWYPFRLLWWYTFQLLFTHLHRKQVVGTGTDVGIKNDERHARILALLLRRIILVGAGSECYAYTANKADDYFFQVLSVILSLV